MFHVKRGAPAALALLGVLALGACSSDSPPAPDSDSAQNYESGSETPVDDAVYTVSIRVAAPVSSMTTQRDPATGTTSGYVGNGGGYVSGSYTGPVESGKGYVRGYVTGITPTPPDSLPKTGDLVILKATDTKVTAIADGDTVDFKCRRQYEAVAAVRKDEKWDATKERRVGTWEFDYCRLSSSVVKGARK